MPVEIVFPGPEWDVHVGVHGALQASEMMEGLERLFVHPDYRSDASWFVECEQVGLEHFGLGALRRLTRFTIEHDARFRGAVVGVAAPQLAVFGLTRMYHLLRQPPYRLAVFRSSEAARAWLTQNAPRPERG